MEKEENLPTPENEDPVESDSSEATSKPMKRKMNRLID